jgi:Family of unknown function (DUF6082)
MLVGGWLVLAVAGLAAVVLSPFGLREIDELYGLRWNELANVGQTYEAVAALLAVPTFGGVIISVLMQRREVQIGQEQTALLTQIEVARLAIEYPELIRTDGSVLDDHSVAQGRRYIMMNLSMNKWRSLFDVGRISEAELRLLVGQLFVRTESRDWWTWARDSYRISVRNRRQRRFFAITEEEHARAAAGASAVEAERDRPSGRTRLTRTGVVCLAAAVMGVLSGWLIRRLNMRSAGGRSLDR